MKELIFEPSSLSDLRSEYKFWKKPKEEHRQKQKQTIKKSDRRWQSDVIVDMIKRYDFKYIALNPGASYRGLHDSLVNYGENDPPMMLCQHEKIAVQIAHGYARATGKPMIAIVHNLVGLLHAPMGIYYSYLDRAPVFIMGATGPMAEPKRRPFIDWIHTANVQGEAIRNFVKWDYQPTTVDGVPGAFARAYSVMMSARQGPVYMVYDAGLQEAQLDHEVEMPPAGPSMFPPRHLRTPQHWRKLPTRWQRPIEWQSSRTLPRDRLMAGITSLSWRKPWARRCGTLAPGSIFQAIIRSISPWILTAVTKT